jgi:hypothetical protein
MSRFGLGCYPRCYQKSGDDETTLTERANDTWDEGALVSVLLPTLVIQGILELVGQFTVLLFCTH